MCNTKAEGSPTQNSVSRQTSGDRLDWARLLADAICQPGIISTAYSRFWNYSVGNQILAIWKRESNRGPARGIVKRMARAEKGATATGRWLG